MAARVAYRVNDLPTTGVGAFSPTLSVPAGQSSWGRVHVVGAPGTIPIPSPKPTGIIPNSFDPKTAGSNNSPDVILPTLYRVVAPYERPPVPIRNHNPMPIPATNIVRVATTSSPAGVNRPKLGGRRVMPWPRVFQRWPTLNAQATSG